MVLSDKKILSKKVRLVVNKKYDFKMSQQKLKKISSNLVNCEKCSIILLNKDAEKHVSDCPPHITDISYPYFANNVLFGNLDLKTNEEVKNLSSRETDNLVFLSQTAIQMCSLSLGQWSLVKLLNSKCPPIAKIVWPTTEKTLMSVLLTKNG